MERESSKKQEWEFLTDFEKSIYYERANFLIENGYMNKERDDLAREIYESKWRVGV